ncbi:MAG: HDOD domain-containing protein [Planctomycetota bacterium]
MSKRAVMEKLIPLARDLKMLPPIAARAIEVADDPDSQLKELADIIALDAGLSISILKLANSPMFPSYAAGKRISCLKMAVTRLGFRQTKQMILVACYANMVESMCPDQVEFRSSMSQHGFLTGTICSKLNHLFGLAMQGEEFTAGLLHDVGRLLLAVSIPNQFSLFDRCDFREGPDVMCMENEAIDTNHCEVGAWFLGRNQMSEELISVAKFHHDPYASIRFTRLVALVQVADILANRHQSEMGLDELDCAEISGLRLLESLGVNDAIERLNAEKETILQESVASLQEFRSI